MASWRRIPFSPELVLALPGVALFIAWGFAEGGFEATSWHPGALLVLGLLALAVFAKARRGERLRPATAVALGLGFGFALWCFASIAWSEAKGDAWEGANRALMYATVFAVFALPRWSPRGAAVTLGAWSLGLAGVAAITLLVTAASDQPVLSFISYRLADPTGYHNAAAGLYLPAVFPALFLASRRETPWAVRGLFLASAAVLVEVAILSQSRGSLIAFPIALALYFAIVPNRARGLVSAAAIALPTALAAPTLFDVFPTIRDGGDVGAAVGAARDAVLLSFGALLVAGTALAWSDRRLEAPARARSASRVVNVLGAAAAAAAVCIALVAIGNPVGWAKDRWEDFKTGTEPGITDARLVSGLGSNRYDFWRVAVEGWADEPVTGLGAEQFSTEYLQHRRSREEPSFAHSMPIEILSQTGLVGALVFGGFIVAALLAAARARARMTSQFARALPCVAVVTAGYWALHASGDWLWAFPALTAPAFAWLGLAGRIDEDQPDPARIAAARSPEAAVDRGARSRLGRRRARLAAVGAGAGLVLAAAASNLLPWAAAADIREAEQVWGARPDVAYERLDRAGGLNFLGDAADVTEGAIAVRLDDLARARAAFSQAIERNPSNWYSQMELGAIEATSGARALALAHLEVAVELNPGEPLARRVLAGARSGRPVELHAIDAALLRRVCELVGRTEETQFCR